MKDFTVTQTLPIQRVSDVLCSAIEGGSNYWYEYVGEVEPKTWEFDSELVPGLPAGVHYLHDYPLNPGGALLLGDMEDSDHGTMRLDSEAVQKGLVVMAEKYPKHFANILTEDDDAETGDVLLQCCLFGGIIYG